MIISKLQGGIGNQMFQYAAGKSLAQVHSTELALDLTSFKKTNRTFDLNLLSIENVLKFKNKNKLNKLLWKDWKKYLPSYLSIKNKKIEIYSEPHFYYDKDFYSNPADCYLEGYWQSEKYFKTIANEIRSEYNLNDSSQYENSNIVTKILKHPSVGIHIRRGDYVSDTVTNKLHGVLDNSFYTKAAGILNSKIISPKFYVFTDDKKWVRRHFKFDYTFELVDEKWEPIYDMFLMSKCCHQIIANSSFSWWAAWLNKNKNKIVVAPKKWFKNKYRNEQTIDLIPIDWLRI